MSKNQRSMLTGLLATTMLFSFSAHADDLLQVYQQALNSDPVFAQAQSTWKSQKMNLPIAKAGYMPTVTVNASALRNYTATSPAFSGNVANGFNGSAYTWRYGYSLDVTQPVFNFVAWASIKNADASVKAATAAYLAAQQSLIQRTATAYFNVLQAYDQLRYTIANKQAVWQQFLTAREQFRVGLIAVTDEYDARSRYDQVVAEQISAQNNLNIQLENLRAITGRGYASLKGIGKQLPLLRPQPALMDQWVSVATQQNYDIKAQNYTVLAAMDTIKLQQAKGYPGLNLQGGISEAHVVGHPPDTAQDSSNFGLGMSYSPIQGGLVNASTKQARYDYVTASNKLEQVHRSVVNQTRSSFLSVLSLISRVRADKQNIISATNALAATKAGLHVGTRTMVDVLNDLSTLYQAQQQYTNDQYGYINNLISLKAAAGTLSVNDLKHINAWLAQSIHFPEQLSVATVPTEGAKYKVKEPNDGVVSAKKSVLKAIALKHKMQSKSVLVASKSTKAKKPMLSLAKLASPQSVMLPPPASS